MAKIDEFTKQVISVMSEGNQVAYFVLCEMAEEKKFEDIAYLGKIRVSGDLLYKLFYYCCDSEIEKLYMTLDFFRSARLSINDIHEKLKCSRPVSFLNIQVTVKGSNLNIKNCIGSIDRFSLYLNATFRPRCIFAFDEKHMTCEYSTNAEAEKAKDQIISKFKL